MISMMYLFNKEIDDKGILVTFSLFNVMKIISFVKKS